MNLSSPVTVGRHIHTHTKRYSPVFTLITEAAPIKEFLCKSLMERYESLGLVGEGSYGTVLKCRHRDSGRLVAIKKFMDSDDDKTVKKIALREIKLLRQLRHDNLVNLLEVWKRRRRWYLVFEFVERTLLDDLEGNPNGLDLNTSRQYLYQILRAAAFCHEQHIIHRDIKPENILISQGGVVKLCDFGFARMMTSPAEGGAYTDYVATRWYRAPELLVGDTKYGKPVDVWAVGCLLIEMLTGQPLFPGDSDLDQIYHIVRCFGNLTAHHQELFYRNPVFSGVRLPECSDRVTLEQRFPSITTVALDLTQSCLQMDPGRRAQCSELLEHRLFTQDSFHIRVLDELNAKIQRDHRENSTLPKIVKSSRRGKDGGDDRNGKGKDRKQSECMDETVNKEKEKTDKEGGEEKTPKTKGKQPSKPKNIWKTSEPLMSTKQSKTGRRIIDNAAEATVAMRRKPGKVTGAEPKKEPEISKPTKTLTSDSLEAPKTATDQKNNNTMLAKPKHQKAASPEPKEGKSKNTDTKDRDSTGFHTSCSDNTVSSVTEKCVVEKLRHSIPESSQDFGKSWSNSKAKVPKFTKCSTTDHPNESSSTKPSLKLIVYPKETNITQKKGKTSSKENPEGSETLVTSKTLKSGQVETSMTVKAFQPFSNDNINVATPTTPSVTKPCKTTTTSELQTNCSNMETEKRRSSECPKILPSNPKPSKTTSNSGPKMTKNNTPLSDSPSKTLTSDLSRQSSAVFIEASPVHSTTTLPRGTLQTGSSSDNKPIHGGTIFVPNKPAKSLPADREPAEICITTKNQQDSYNNSKNDSKEDHGCLKMSLTTETATNHTEISSASGEDYKKSPEPSESCNFNQEITSKSKISTESRATLTSMPNEIPKTNMSPGTTAPKTLEVSDKKNREDSARSVSISATSKSLVNQTSKVSGSSNIKHKNNTSEAKNNIKHFKSSRCKSLIGETETELWSFSNHPKATTAVSSEQKKRDDRERINTTNTDSTLFTSSVTLDHKALIRRSLSCNMDTADADDFDFSLLQSSPSPPPPPPPSSTPLLLPPSSTPLIPSFSAISTDSQAVCDHLTVGAGFHLGAKSFRCVDKPKHQDGSYSLAQQPLSSHITGPLAGQVSEKSLVREHSFLSDRCNHGNNDSITATKKKSDIHFPDLRSSVLPELRGKEGKHNKSTCKDQRRDRQSVASIPSLEPHQQGFNSDSH